MGADRLACVLLWSAAAAPAQEAGPGGWTRLSPPRDAHVIHVSSGEGDDRFDGLSPRRPVRTIGRGKALLRPGRPDWLLLKAGDVWDEPLGPWKTGGASRREPAVVGAYGEGARPVLRHGGSSGFAVYGREGIEHVFLVGLEFYNDRRDPASPRFDPAAPPVPGLFWSGGGNDVLVEDCVFRFHKDAIVFQRAEGVALTDVRIRRCIAVDAWNTRGHAQGLYADSVDGLVIEENVFDRNGWNPAVPGAVRTIFNHNLYVQHNCRRVTVRGNVLARAASHGVQLRPGGRVEGNLLVRNAIGLTSGGERVEVLDNVFLESDDLSPSERRGWGIEMRRHPKGALYRGNLLIRRDSPSGVAALVMAQQPLPGAEPLIVQDNVVWKWSCSTGGIFVAQPDQADVLRSGNIVDGLDEAGRPVRLPDPGRDLEAYAKSLRLSGGVEAFLGRLRQRKRLEWDPRWTAAGAAAYVRAGYVRTSGRR